ncbi:hypothetical protein M885DRAFT_619424 [Pelagophyceae sp. CCMP2097]|nr:hypothetical protein M885DRAFT_619424 [Pelagophyceae sp. CCMP2097]
MLFVRVLAASLCAAVHAFAPRAPAAATRAPPRDVVRHGGKDILISVWLFGGLVPALAAVNAFALNKLRAPLPEGYVSSVETATDTKLPLASLFSPDAVFLRDAADALKGAKQASDLGPLRPLNALMGAPPSPTGGSALLYLKKDDFKATVRKRARRQLPDAALDAIFDSWAGGSGVAAENAIDASLQAWRTADGGLDAGALDLAALRGKFTIFAGYSGLLVLDGLALAALAFGVKSQTAP